MHLKTRWTFYLLLASIETTPKTYQRPNPHHQQQILGCCNLQLARREKIGNWIGTCLAPISSSSSSLIPIIIMIFNIVIIILIIVVISYANNITITNLYFHLYPNYRDRVSLDSKLAIYEFNIQSLNGWMDQGKSSEYFTECTCSLWRLFRQSFGSYCISNMLASMRDCHQISGISLLLA